MNDKFFEKIHIKTGERFINDRLDNEYLSVERYTFKKFLNDKCLFDNEKFTIVIEGIILNSVDLITEYNTMNIGQCAIKMYTLLGDKFFDDFRGSFCGILLDKKKNRIIAFSDHLALRQLFYSEVGDSIIISSDLEFLIKYYNYNEISYSMNLDKMYELIRLGWIDGENICINEFKRVLPGEYFIIHNRKFTVSKFYELKMEPNKSRTEEETIEEMDRLFCKAVKLQFEKDREYGYQHMVALSGGLDSRMTTMVANELGYGEAITNQTFSEDGYLDKTIAKKIASDLKHKWIFKSISGGEYLKHLEKSAEINAGTITYIVPTVVDDEINWDNYGMQHTGNLGDAVIGSVISDKNYFHKPRLLRDWGTNLGGNFPNFDNKVPFQLTEGRYEQEVFLSRVLLLPCKAFVYSQKNHSENMSPFLFLEFFNFCMTIPIEWRMNHKIYYKWINKKHPKAANYVYERIKSKINEKQIKILGATIPISRVPRFLYVRLLKKINPKKAKTMVYSHETKNHMNPYTYWYNTNSNLREYLDNYFNDNISRTDKYDELSKDLSLLYKKGNVYAKINVLSLLSFLKIYDLEISNGYKYPYELELSKNYSYR